MRIVLDTNLLVSGVIGAGMPRRLIDAAKSSEFELCTRELLLAERLDVLSRDTFAVRLDQADLSPEQVVDDLRHLAVVVLPTDTPRVVASDPDDDHVLAAAIAGQADLIASGDKRDLLPMRSYKGIAIVSAREAVARLEASARR